jgi:hypothetical protein
MHGALYKLTPVAIMYKGGAPWQPLRAKKLSRLDRGAATELRPYMILKPAALA